jgi:hypothetical protein
MLTAYGSSKALLPKTEKNTNKTFSMLTVGDFNRIKSHILPTEASDLDARTKKNEELHKKSQTRMRKWPDSIEMIKKTQMESRKKIFFEEEKRKRILDQEEARFKEYQKQVVNDRAEKLLFDNQDVVKSFKSNLLLTDVLNEREFQKEITLKKQEINKKIDEKWFEMEKETQE